MAYPPDVNSGGTFRNLPPLLSHRSLYAVSFDGYDETEVTIHNMSFLKVLIKPLSTKAPAKG